MRIDKGLVLLKIYVRHLEKSNDRNGKDSQEREHS